MDFPVNFIKATDEYNSFEKHIPAPYMVKEIFLDGKPEKADIVISGLGFYKLFINGKDITKGHLAPYISNPEHFVYYDCYKIEDKLEAGENTIGLILGNGFLNNPGGHVWDFDKASFRSSPMAAFRVTAYLNENRKQTWESDEKTRTFPSPILFDDYRCGEIYDAGRELKDWALPGFDRSNWKYALTTSAPCGEKKFCEAEPVKKIKEIKPVSVTKTKAGYVYDFGVNSSGVCRLKIDGEEGQIITLYHSEILGDEIPERKNISFPDSGPEKNEYIQKSVYVCRGNTTENHTPDFVYFGFRYVLVKGIRDDQATKDLLTYVVIHSDVKEKGGFSCSDKIAENLQKITRQSDLTNLHYFPTDCPQREKNGWTADAALSAEHMLLNLSVEKIYCEWLNNIRKAQKEDGSLPGIIPTSGWGYNWGNGPAWDSVLTYLPYYTYIYRGDKSVIRENASAVFRYLHYITTIRNEEGLVKKGLGDWCQAGREFADYDAPLEVTDTLMSMDISKKAAFIFKAAGLKLQMEFAEKLYGELKESFRNYLVDFDTMTVKGRCQTSQAMAIYFEVFSEKERTKAFCVLCDLINESEGHMNTGVLGGRVIFHVLSDFGRSDLAFEMITRKDYPSYGNWLERGATTLWEEFRTPETPATSRNHHFWGDISHWFMRWLAGININPSGNDVNHVDIKPHFIEKIEYAEGWHQGPEGKILCKWEKKGEKILLETFSEGRIHGRIFADKGYIFEDNTFSKTLKPGKYSIKKII